MEMAPPRFFEGSTIPMVSRTHANICQNRNGAHAISLHICPICAMISPVDKSNVDRTIPSCSKG